MADVFISYAREDQGFVRKLCDALKSHGRDAWVDWTNIPPTVEWLREIFAGIEGTAVFVFLISPDSVRSPVCAQEIAHAVEHHKRLVPILHRPVEDSAVAPALSVRNWIRLGQEDDLNIKLPEVLRAIETDWEWVNQHKRLTTRAVEWRDKSREKSLLLRGRDLTSAERWLARAREAAAGEDHRPTQLQTEYIAASRLVTSKRQRVFLIGAIVTVAVMAVLAILAYLQREEAVRQGGIALSRQLAAQAQVMVLQQPNLIGRAGLLAIEAAQLHPSLETDQALRTVLGVLPLPQFPLPCKKGVEELAFSPHGDALLVADGDGVLRRWNLPNHKQEWELPLDRQSEVVGISSDLSQLAIWNGHEQALSIEILKDRRVVPLAPEGEMGGPSEVVFSSDSRFCIARTNHRSWIFETATGVFVNKGKWAAAFTPSGELRGCAEEKDGFKVFAVNTGRVIAILPGFETAEPSDAESAESDDDTGLFSTSLSRNGQFAATWHGRRVRVYEVATQGAAPQPLGEITSDQEVYDAQVDNRGRFVVVRGERRVQTRIWALSPQIKEFGRFSDYTASCVRFSPDGRRFATAGPSVDSVRLWWTIGGEEVHTIKTNRDPKTFDSDHRDRMAAINATGEFLAVAGTADEVWLYDLKAWRKLATLRHKGVTYIAISQLGDCIVTADGENGANVWRFVRVDGKITGVTHPVAMEQGHGLGTMCLSADGSRFMATRGGGYDGVIYIWNTADGKSAGSVTVPDFSIDAICCSAKGEVVAANNATSTVRVLSVKDGRLKCFVDHPQHAWYIALSPDGRYLATAASRDSRGYQAGDFQVRLWEVSTGKQLAAATHDREVNSVFFSRDGRSLVTASTEDGTSRVWALTSAPSGTLTGVTEISRLADPDAVSATADMRYLVTAGADAVRIWPLNPEDLIAEVQARSFRNLTRSEWEFYLGGMPYRKTCPNLPEAPVESGGSTSPTPLVSQVSPSPSPSGAEGLTEAKHYLDLGDYAKALSPLQKAADGGNTSAMNNLGDLYYDGKGVAQDYGKAREWYQKAADAGNAVAMTNLGWLYGNGKGVAQDYGKARECYQKAADAGNTDAMYNLGVLYANGKGVAQDYDKAREWYQKAADAGNTDAKQALAYPGFPER